MSSNSIIRKEGFNCGQPSLKEGYTVLQVVKLVEEEYSIGEAAERLGVKEESVKYAWEYYQNNKEEIEEIRSEEKKTIQEYSDAGTL